MLTERHVSGSLFRAFVQLDTVAERARFLDPSRFLLVRFVSPKIARASRSTWTHASIEILLGELLIEI